MSWKLQERSPFKKGPNKSHVLDSIWEDTCLKVVRCLFTAHSLAWVGQPESHKRMNYLYFLATLMCLCMSLFSRASLLWVQCVCVCVCILYLLFMKNCIWNDQWALKITTFDNRQTRQLPCLSVLSVTYNNGRHTYLFCQVQNTETWFICVLSNDFS